MKKYIFLTMNTSGINGAEQYILNKMNYLRVKGFQVYVFSGRTGKIVISAFEPFQKLIHPALRFYPSYLNKREMSAFIQWVLSELDIQEGDNFTIESSNITCALWGEIIAKALRCRNMAYILTEHFCFTDAEKRFLRYKLDRHELTGIREESVKQMLGDMMPDRYENTSIRAFCNNVVQKCEDRYSDMLDPGTDYTIGSLGRMEKKYVLTMLDDLCDYFSRNGDKTFNLVMIGGCADKRQLKAIQAKIAPLANVKLILTGMVYPVPETFVNRMDLFVSAAGSASATYYAMCPTIKVSYENGKPIGIIGYDYDIHRGTNKTSDITLGDYVDMILTGSTRIDWIENYAEDYERRMATEFERHLAMAAQPCAKDYYDTLPIVYADAKYRVGRWVSKIFGVRAAYRMVERVRRFVRE